LTTVRKHVENGNIEFILDYWKSHKGQVPLCCFEVVYKKDRTFMISCAWLEGKYTYAEFTILCLVCQKEIEKKIDNYLSKTS